MQEYVGASGGLGVIWNHRKVTLNILKSNNNWINGLVKSVKSNLKFILINIYGPVSNIQKKLVWEEIYQFMKNLSEQSNNIRGRFQYYFKFE